jgi:glycosyltransferase involved in cell wall biosynthesis
MIGLRTVPAIHGSVLVVSRCAQTIFAQRRALMTGLRKLGWIVFCAGETKLADPYPQRLNSCDFDFHPLSIRQKSYNPLALAILVLECVLLIKRTRPQVVHAFTVKPMIAATLAAWMMDVPARLVTVAGAGHLFLGKAGLRQKLSLVLLRFALRRAHCIIFYNRDDEELYRQHDLVGEMQIAHVPGSGIDISHFGAVALPDESTPYTLLYIGRFLREKGVSELLEAASLLKNRGAKIRIVMLGDVDENNPSSIRREQVRAAVLAGLVVHVPATDDVRSHIAAAHAIVLPSYREGIPLVLLEAGAMQRPVIATDVPGCRDVVCDGQTGLLVPAGNAEILADTMAALAADPSRAATLGVAARVHVSKHFSCDALTTQVESLYRQCLESRCVGGAFH